MVDQVERIVHFFCQLVANMVAGRFGCLVAIDMTVGVAIGMTIGLSVGCWLEVVLGVL